LDVGADERAAVEDRGDLTEPRADPDAVDRRRDRRKGADHVGDGEPRLERRVAFRVERVGGGHPAGHPQDDDRVGTCRRRRRRGAEQPARFGEGERRPGRGGQRADELTARSGLRGGFMTSCHRSVSRGCLSIGLSTPDPTSRLPLL